MKKILCVGSVTTDIIVSPVDSVPPPGTLRAVDSTTVHVGGCASNAAIDLAKLGVPVALSCKVGTDSFGDFVLSQCTGAGADVSGIVRDSSVGTTSSVVCVSSEGERSFLYNPGSTSAFTLADTAQAPLAQCDIVFIAGAMLLSAFDGAPCAAFLSHARELGKFTVMDTAWDFDNVWLPKIEAALPGLDLFMPSREEAEMLSGKATPVEMADFFFDLGVKSVIIKTGKSGAYFCPNREERFTLPAYKGIKAVDTTGAGDSFCAGFLCGLAQGWDFRRSGAFANAVGAHCVQSLGASSGIPHMSQILSFMENTPL